MKEKLEALTRDWQANPVDTAKLPPKVPVAALITLPDLYQPRKTNETSGVSDNSHVDKLAAHLKDPEADLDPITVLHVNGQNIVIDGHHRLKAYKKAKNKSVPVRYYTKGPLEALVEAGKENVKDRLQMSHAEKSQRAWDLVRSGLPLTVKQIQQASGRSKRTVASMREQLKKYQQAGKDAPEHWWQVGREDDENWDGEVPERVKEQIQEWTDRLRQHFPPLDQSGAAQIFAMAIIECWPKRSADITRNLVGELGMYEELREAADRIDEENADVEDSGF